MTSPSAFGKLTILWTDPPLAKRYAEIVRTTYRGDPKNADYYDTNLPALRRRPGRTSWMPPCATSFKTIPNQTAADLPTTTPTSSRRPTTGRLSAPFRSRTLRINSEGGVFVGQVKREKVPTSSGRRCFPTRC